MVFRFPLLVVFGLAALVQRAEASCTTETFDFDSGAEGWSKYGHASVSFGGAAYISGDPGGCYFQAMQQTFDGGDSLSISYSWVASSTSSGTTNQSFQIQDASTGSSLFSEYAHCGHCGGGSSTASGTYSNSFSSEIEGVDSLTILMGYYDCWSTNYSQTNTIDDITIEICREDEDDDGYTEDDGDCDDADSSAYPGASEICDGVDNDCDGDVDEDEAADVLTWYLDSDGDGFGDAGSSDIDCEQPSGFVDDDTDCDDASADVHPSASEICDEIDNDCDGAVDDDDLDVMDALVWFIDADGDGYGASTYTSEACEAPSGYVSNDTDCDDLDDGAWPGATEVCDDVDNDCDGSIDEVDALDTGTWYADLDGDGYGDPENSSESCEASSGFVADDTDCDDTDETSHPGAEENWYDGIDSDCDGWSDYDADGDGYDHEDHDGTDCDDADEDVHIDATETWYDGIDSDCDGWSDYDADGDGQDSQTYEGEDCDDADPDTYAGAPDTPYDGLITDCENADDYDADGDGVVSVDYQGEDCDDANSDIHPDAKEIWYDGIDQDCDGNDDDQDGDGWSVDADCDDTDAASFPDNGELDSDCEPITDSWDTGHDTASDEDSGDGGEDSVPGKDEGCFNSTAGLQPVGGWVLLMAALLGLRRRP